MRQRAIAIARTEQRAAQARLLAAGLLLPAALLLLLLISP